MAYAEYPPPPLLASHVRCIWTFVSEGATGPDRIVPDGRPELIVHFGAPYSEIHADGVESPQAAAIFAGQLTRPLTLRSRGGAGVVGVRFHPDGARAFLGAPLREATDRRLALDAGPHESALLASEMAQAGDDDARVCIASGYVARRIAASGHEPDTVVRECVRRIEQACGAVEVEVLVAGAGIGRRQLERRFGDAVGVGPALLAAIFRFRGAFDVLERGGSRPWTEAALAAGYYDQSHFIREFRRFVGCTPSEFLDPATELARALAGA